MSRRDGDSQGGGVSGGADERINGAPSPMIARIAISQMPGDIDCFWFAKFGIVDAGAAFTEILH